MLEFQQKRTRARVKHLPCKVNGASNYLAHAVLTFVAAPKVKAAGLADDSQPG